QRCLAAAESMVPFIAPLGRSFSPNVAHSVVARLVKRKSLAHTSCPRVLSFTRSAPSGPAVVAAKQKCWTTVIETHYTSRSKTLSRPLHFRRSVAGHTVIQLLKRQRLPSKQLESSWPTTTGSTR